MERFDGTAVSLRIVITLASTNHVTVSIFVPFLSTNQVEPTITFAIELAAAFIQNIVDVNGCRRAAVISALKSRSTPCTRHCCKSSDRTGTKHVPPGHGQTCRLVWQSLRQLRQQPDKVRRTWRCYTDGYFPHWAVLSGAVVCTIRAEFQRPIYIAAYRIQSQYPVGTTGQRTCSQIAFEPSPVVYLIHILEYEREYRFTFFHFHSVGIGHRFPVLSGCRPVAAINSSKKYRRNGSRSPCRQTSW